MNELLSQLCDGAKNIMLLIITTMASIYVPLHDVFNILLFAFTANIFAGIVADVNINKNRFCIKKAFDAVKHLGFYMFLVVFFFQAGTSLKDEVIRDYGVKWATLIVLYYYITNISRNCLIVFPNNKGIEFIYLVLTTQIFNKLKEVFGFKNNDKNLEL